MFNPLKKVLRKIILLRIIYIKFNWNKCRIKDEYLLSHNNKTSGVYLKGEVILKIIVIIFIFHIISTFRYIIL